MESISVFDIFKIGVGPSSSHTLGPWRAAQRFLAARRARGQLDRITGLRIELFGSLAKTGKGHGTDIAVLLGLCGEEPTTCDTSRITERAAAIRASRQIALEGTRTIPFDSAAQLVFHRDRALPYHPNALRFTAELDDGTTEAETYYSIGGGFVVGENDRDGGERRAPCPYPIDTAADLLAHTLALGCSIPQVVRLNELTWKTAGAIDAGLAHIWETMRACIFRGAGTDGVLPGPLGVARRAAKIQRKLLGDASFDTVDDWLAAIRERDGGFRAILEWVSCFALAVNEENAAFGRVVTAPTNGAAGVVPAVLMFHSCFGNLAEGSVEDFLLTAGEIGSLFKKEATLSAAQGGCQAEIGVSSAMAAAGLCQVSGGSVGQVLMAAEIAMEHHLGLTCDPVGGLVQIPCIERNTMGAIKAITACELALVSDPALAKVPLDAVIRSMWATAQDMNTKYKETSEGGLAVQVPVNIAEC